MTFLEVYGAGFVVITALMTVVWLVSLRLVDSSIVDMIWGLGFVLVALAYFVLTNGFMMRKILVLAVVAIWGLRLSLHIFLRNKGHGEDFRYQRWRRQHGDSYWWVSFFRVFLLQGVLLWIISIPILAAQFSSRPDTVTILDVAGLVIWGIGFIFEAVGDWQLVCFKRNPENKGKLLTTGLWAWTRHPNYFGDAAVWWGIFLFAVSAPGGIFTISAPLIMTFLLMRVSGVTLLEKTMKAKPGYEAYMESTPAFIPRPPHRRG